MTPEVICHQDANSLAYLTSFPNQIPWISLFFFHLYYYHYCSLNYHNIVNKNTINNSNNTCIKNKDSWKIHGMVSTDKEVWLTLWLTPLRRSTYEAINCNTILQWTLHVLSTSGLNKNFENSEICHISQKQQI